MRALGHFLIDQLIPIILAAALNLAPRFGYFTLLPLSRVIEREYGNYALVLGCAGALVASVSFSREGTRFDLSGFVMTALAGLIAITPFILGRAGITVGMSPRQFDVLTAFAYLGFFIVGGVLIGGCWSLVVRAFREAHERRWGPPLG